MTVPVIRTTDCEGCKRLWNTLDAKLAVARTHDDREHLMAAVISWWVANSVGLFDGQIAPTLFAFTAALRESGFNADLTRPAAEGATPRAH